MLTKRDRSYLTKSFIASPDKAIDLLCSLAITLGLHSEDYHEAYRIYLDVNNQEVLHKINLLKDFIKSKGYYKHNPKPDSFIVHMIEQDIKRLEGELK